MRQAYAFRRRYADGTVSPDEPDIGSATPSEVFDNLICKSHEMVSRVDVLFNREVISEGLPVTGGSVAYDRQAGVLASCNLTIADPLRVPVSSDDILTPFGSEVRVWRGIRAGGGEMLVPLITAPIQRSSVDAITLLSSITAQDRSKTVSDAKFEDVYQVASGTNYATAIEALIEDGAPGLEFSFPSTTYTTPLLTFAPDDDRWAMAQKMTRSIGYTLQFDGLGVCVMKAEPSFDDEATACIAEGGNMVGAVVDLDRTPAYNKVIATSANASSGEVFRGEAEDDDPSSPTYYSGPFGKKSRRFSSPLLASDDQCRSAAESILASNLGVARSVSASLVTDPRIEPGDVVTVDRSAVGLNNDKNIVEQASIGLAASDTMTLSVRAKQA